MLIRIDSGCRDMDGRVTMGPVVVHPEHTIIILPREWIERCHQGTVVVVIVVIAIVVPLVGGTMRACVIHGWLVLAVIVVHFVKVSSINHDG